MVRKGPVALHKENRRTPATQRCRGSRGDRPKVVILVGASRGARLAGRGVERPSDEALFVLPVHQADARQIFECRAAHVLG